MIAGKLSISKKYYKKKAYVLFNSRLRHMFVSIRFTKLLGKAPTKLDIEFLVSTTTRSVMSVTSVLKSCEVEIDKKKKKNIVW